MPLLARQAGVLRDEVSLLNALARQAAPDPEMRKRSPPCPSRWPGERCANGSRKQVVRAAGSRAYPPSLAEVERVLAVAAGTAVATEISGGRRVRRSAGRLSVEGLGSDSVTPVIPDETGGAVPGWAAPEVGPVLVDQFRLAARVAELGAQITEDYADDPPCWWPSSRAPCSS